MPGFDPSGIPTGVFTRRMGVAAGLTKDDLLRARHITRVGSDLYTAAGTQASPAAQAIALARTFPAAWVSHHSAATIRGITLEQPHSRPQLTAPNAASRIRRAGIDCAVDRFGGLGVTDVDNFRISSPARTWLEIADPNSLRRAVALGDQLVRIPRQTFEGRSEPICALEDLLALVEKVSDRVTRTKPRGLTPEEWQVLAAQLTNLRSYAQLIRVGADSPPETALRLALIHAGLPEPMLQYPVLMDGRVVTVIDLAYPEAQLALHYDGAPHLSRESLSRDIARDNLLVSLGWVNLRAGRADFQQGFRAQIAQARALLGSRTRG